MPSTQPARRPSEGTARGRLDSVRGIGRQLVAAAKDFGKDDALTHSAAVALYAAVSLAPLIVLLLALGDVVGGDARRTFLDQVGGLVGPLGGKAVESVAESAGAAFETRRTPLVIALAVAAFSATAVFAQLQQALNHVWNVEAEPGWNLGRWVKKRLLTFGMLAVVGLLLLVSLAVSAGLAMAFSGEGWIWSAGEVVVSVAVSTALFAAVFRFLPDVEITWRETWIGAFATAVLFAVGKFAIGTYLGMSGIDRTYGAMGSLLALLLWVYWSSAIVLYGAELTQVRASSHRVVRPRGPAKRETKKPSPVATR
jgi:membrane protein